MPKRPTPKAARAKAAHAKAPKSPEELRALEEQYFQEVEKWKKSKRAESANAREEETVLRLYRSLMPDKRTLWVALGQTLLDHRV